MNNIFDFMLLILVCCIIGSCVENKISERDAKMAMIMENSTYKQGQIDAIAGIIKYHLMTNDVTREVTWELITP